MHDGLPNEDEIPPIPLAKVLKEIQVMLEGKRASAEEEEPEELPVLGLMVRSEDEGRLAFVIDRKRERVARAMGVYPTWAGVWEDESPSQTPAMAIVFDTTNPSPLVNGRRELLVVLDSCVDGLLYTALTNMLPAEDADTIHAMIMQLHQQAMDHDRLPMVAETSPEGEEIQVIDGWDDTADAGHALIHGEELKDQIR